MSAQNAVLHFFCAPRSNCPQLAKQVARRFNAELIGNENRTTLSNEMHAKVVALLLQGKNVVVELPANTPADREEFQKIVDETGARHLLHYAVSTTEAARAMVPPAVREGFNVEIRAI